MISNEFISSVSQSMRAPRSPDEPPFLPVSSRIPRSLIGCRPKSFAPLDGMTLEHVALDVHVGSVAIKRFVEERQPSLTLHGHVHEATRLTGQWKIRIGRTVCINGAHDGPELALVRFDLESPDAATRELL